MPDLTYLAVQLQKMPVETPRLLDAASAYGARNGSRDGRCGL